MQLNAIAHITNGGASYSKKHGALLLHVRFYSVGAGCALDMGHGFKEPKQQRNVISCVLLE